MEIDGTCQAEAILSAISIALGQGTSSDFVEPQRGDMIDIAKQLVKEFPDAEIKPYYFEMAWHLKETSNG